MVCRERVLANPTHHTAFRKNHFLYSFKKELIMERYQDDTRRLSNVPAYQDTKTGVQNVAVCCEVRHALVGRQLEPRRGK